MKTHNDQERVYPCDECGKLRSKDEGGNTFTLCDACWDKHYKKSHHPSQTMKRISELEIRKCSLMAMKEAQLYGDDGQPLLEIAIADAQLDADRQEYERAIREIFGELNEPCEHDPKTPKKRRAKKRECLDCWQKIQAKWVKVQSERER
jgi:hypothetical protein